VAKRRAHGEGTISKRKDGRWEGRVSDGYTDKGTPKRPTVYGRTQAEVKQKLDLLKQRLQSGTYTASRLTVAVFLESYLVEKARDVKPSTLEQYEICVHRCIVPHIGGLRLDKLTPVQVQTFLGTIRDAFGVARAIKCRSVLFSAYKQAVRLQVVVSNPVEAVDRIPHKRREVTLWEAEEAAQFLTVAQEHRLYAFFYVTLATGLRRGELLGLRWQDIEASTIHVKQAYVKVRGKLVLSTPKNRNAFRSVAISPDVLEVLLLHRQQQEKERLSLGAYWPENDLVFTSEVGTPLNPDNLKRVRNALMDRAGVPRATLHNLRHLHASVAIESGMDAKMLAERLGHARASFTLDRYTHLFEAQRAKSAVSLPNWLKPPQDTEK
jgi:integrase